MGMNDRAADAKSERKAKKPATKGGKPVWVGFIDVELSDKDKVACKEATLDFDSIWKDMEDLVEDGYKMSLSFDEPHTTWNVSLTCNAFGDENAGYTMSGRGGSFAAAVRSIWYKHTVMLKGIWGAGNHSGGAGMKPDDFG